MGSQGKIPLQKGLHGKDLSGDLKGKLGVACDLMGRISWRNSTLKGISLGGFLDLIGDLMGRGIT